VNFICNSSLLTQHAVNKQFFLFYRVNKAYNLVIQQFFQHNLLFANNGLLVNSFLPPPSVYTYTHVRSTGESLTNYVALLRVEIGQPCPRGWFKGRKVKVNFALSPAIKAQRGSRDMALLFL